MILIQPGMNAAKRNSSIIQIRWQKQNQMTDEHTSRQITFTLLRRERKKSGVCLQLKRSQMAEANLTWLRSSKPDGRPGEEDEKEYRDED